MRSCQLSQAIPQDFIEHLPALVAQRPDRQFHQPRGMTLVDQFTRECVGLEADRSMTGMKVAQMLASAKQERGNLPESITVDNGSEFCSRALEA